MRFCNPAAVHRYRFFYFGTHVEITLAETESPLEGVLYTQIDRLLRHLHVRWHPWQPGDLSTLNTTLKSGQWVRVDPEMWEMLKKAQLFYRQSQGYFNPALGGLFKVWGFHRDLPAPLWDAARQIREIERFKVNLPTPLHLKFNPQNLTVQSRHPLLQWDLSGFIKGKIMLEIADLLEKNAKHNVLIDIGGDLYALGNRGGKPWRIGIAQPRDLKAAPWIVLLGDHQSIATSGVYARYYDQDQANRSPGTRRHHVINPKTLAPSEGFYSVTVRDSDPLRADAAATAILVAGPQAGALVAKSLHVEQVWAFDWDYKSYVY
jgi:thiamine biosynthesis lipoprotein